MWLMQLQENNKNLEDLGNKISSKKKVIKFVLFLTSLETISTIKHSFILLF